MVDHVILRASNPDTLRTQFMDYPDYHVVGYQINPSSWHYVILEHDSELDDVGLLHRRVNALALRMTRAASLLEDIDTDKMSLGDYRVLQRVLSELTEEESC